MPLYIVRWVNLSATLIRAEDEDHLQELLDEIGDPGAAIWGTYNGPVWIEFQPEQRQHEPGKFVIATDLNARPDPRTFCECRARRPTRATRCIGRL